MQNTLFFLSNRDALFHKNAEKGDPTFPILIHARENVNISVRPNRFVGVANTYVNSVPFRLNILRSTAHYILRTSSIPSSPFKRAESRHTPSLSAY